MNGQSDVSSPMDYQTHQFNRIGILYHPRLAAAKDLAQELLTKLRDGGYDSWTSSAWDDSAASEKLDGSDLFLSIGGDGTVLRVARVAMDMRIPILGVNMGQLGFMNEISAEDARSGILGILSEPGRIESRAVLKGKVSIAADEEEAGPFHALNDMVVARAGVSRVIRIETRIDGDLFTTYRADGVIVATATGSTSYSMAVGGPILWPESRELVLTPIAPHLAIRNPLVLAPTAQVELTVYGEHGAHLSVDGQMDHPLADGDRVSISGSSESISFLRFQPSGRFYSTVTHRLTRFE